MFMKRKIKSAKGFTLAELLIVVAIIAVLVAIGIPIFTSQLEKSREAVDLSDVRSAYAEVMMAAITGDTTAIYTKDANQTIYNQAEKVYSITVKPLKQKQDGWQTALPITIGGVSSTDNVHWVGTPGANGECVITYNPPAGAADEAVKFTWSGGTGEENSGAGGNGGGISGGNSGAGEDNGNNDISGGNNSGQVPTPTPEINNGNYYESVSSVVNKIGYGNWPESQGEGVKVDYNPGEIALYSGKYYVCFGKCMRDFKWYYNTPEQTGCFVALTGKIYTPSSLNSLGQIPSINGGDIYIDINNDIYISHNYTTNEAVPPASKHEIWVKLKALG